MDINGIGVLSRDVAKIIKHHGNGVIEIMASTYLLRVLQLNRDKIERASRIQILKDLCN